MESAMPDTFRRWRAKRRYRTTLRELRGLSERELRQLGIRPAEIGRLALHVSRAG
jgi:uncharacterized protein YjiS (DUF1127 family)